MVANNLKNYIISICDEEFTFFLATYRGKVEAKLSLPC